MPQQKRVVWGGAELGGDTFAAAACAGEGTEVAGGGGGEGGAAGGGGGSGILVDISRFYPDALAVVTWIQGELHGVELCGCPHLVVDSGHLLFLTGPPCGGGLDKG